MMSSDCVMKLQNPVVRMKACAYRQNNFKKHSITQTGSFLNNIELTNPAFTFLIFGRRKTMIYIYIYIYLRKPITYLRDCIILFLAIQLTRNHQTIKSVNRNLDPIVSKLSQCKHSSKGSETVTNQCIISLRKHVSN